MSAMFIDFPKAFDTINHGLLLSKLPAYGFSKQALSFRLKEVTAGVPQGSIYEPLIFNLFINDIFLFICFSTLSNYADDNHLFTTGTDIQLIK